MDPNHHFRRPSFLAVGYSARSLVAAITEAGFSAISVDHFADFDTEKLASETVLIKPWAELSIADELLSGRSMSWQLKRHASIHLPASSPPNFRVTQPPSRLLPDTRPLTDLGPLRYSQSDKDSHTDDKNCRLPLLLGGALENYPDLVHELSQSFDVIGADAAQMRQLRRLSFVQSAAEAAGLRFPSSWGASLDLPPQSQHSFASEDERWLRKPLAGAGGVGIEPHRQCQALPPNHYRQRYIPGRPLGVCCLLDPGRSRILGAYRSLTDSQWPGPSEFAYRGSLGPVELPRQQRRQLQAVAEWVAEVTGLRGWLQMDLVEDVQGQLWLLEFNPRWAAGMEVLVRSGIDVVSAHLEAAYPEILEPVSGRDIEANPAPVGGTGETRRYSGKAIFYAPASFRLTAKLLAVLHELPADQYADIPSSRQIGQTIAARQPLLTLLSHYTEAAKDTPDEKEVEAALIKSLHLRLEELQCRLGFA